jgi:hypothetical protein
MADPVEFTLNSRLIPDAKAALFEMATHEGRGEFITT